DYRTTTATIKYLTLVLCHFNDIYFLLKNLPFLISLDIELLNDLRNSIACDDSNRIPLEQSSINNLITFKIKCIRANIHVFDQIIELIGNFVKLEKLCFNCQSDCFFTTKQFGDLLIKVINLKELNLFISSELVESNDFYWMNDLGHWTDKIHCFGLSTPNSSKFESLLPLEELLPVDDVSLLSLNQITSILAYFTNSKFLKIIFLSIDYGNLYELYIDYSCLLEYFLESKSTTTILKNLKRLTTTECNFDYFQVLKYFSLTKLEYLSLVFSSQCEGNKMNFQDNLSQTLISTTNLMTFRIQFYGNDMIDIVEYLLQTFNINEYYRSKNVKRNLIYNYLILYMNNT
ncbi:unnamed protein product, partial [Didymodactylos carnosus]